MKSTTRLAGASGYSRTLCIQAIDLSPYDWCLGSFHREIDDLSQGLTPKSTQGHSTDQATEKVLCQCAPSHTTIRIESVQHMLW